MTMAQWLAGPNGQLLSSLSAIVILSLMLFMAVKLYISYSNKTVYRWLIAAISLLAAQQGTLAALAAPALRLPASVELFANVLQIVSFIIINFVFMKLYTNRSAQLKVVPFLLMAALAAALTAVQFFLEPYGADTGGTAAFPLLDLYGIVVTLIILLATRSADMNTKFYAGLVVYFAAELARLSDLYVFEGGQAWLSLLRLLLPVVYFALLFMLLFEWVIDRLLSTYQSSIVDGLTGLYNRRHFNAKAESLLAKSKKAAVIFCDIDNFKKLNDTHGHHKADGVLKKVAEIIKEEASGIGAAGRYGGEELLACIGTDRVKPDIVAESIRRRVEAETIVTVSVGFSTTKETASLQDLIKQADAAMYYSKTTGKNRVTSFRSMPASAKSMQA